MPLDICHNFNGTTVSLGAKMDRASFFFQYFKFEFAHGAAYIIRCRLFKYAISAPLKNWSVLSGTKSISFCWQKRLIVDV